MFSLISSNGLISIYAKGAFHSKKVILIRKIVTYLYVLLFTVPCESGNYWKCDVSSCVACPQGFYQPQWGQTSCWPCPFNTTTDFEGASSPTECKREHQTNSIACFLFRPHPGPHPDPFSDLLKITNQKSLILQLYNLNFRAKNPKNLQS